MPRPLSVKAKKKRLILGIVVGTVLLLAGLGAVVTLNQSNQDLRQQAFGETYVKCTKDLDCPYNYRCGGTTCVLRESTIKPSPWLASEGQHCNNWVKCAENLACVAGKCIKIPGKITPTQIPTPTKEILKRCSLRNPICPSGYYCDAVIPRAKTPVQGLCIPGKG